MVYIEPWFAAECRKQDHAPGDWTQRFDMPPEGADLGPSFKGCRACAYGPQSRRCDAHSCRKCGEDWLPLGPDGCCADKSICGFSAQDADYYRSY